MRHQSPTDLKVSAGSEKWGFATLKLRTYLKKPCATRDEGTYAIKSPTNLKAPMEPRAYLKEFCATRDEGARVIESPTNLKAFTRSEEKMDSLLRDQKHNSKNPVKPKIRELAPSRTQPTSKPAQGARREKAARAPHKLRAFPFNKQKKKKQKKKQKKKKKERALTILQSFPHDMSHAKLGG